MVEAHLISPVTKKTKEDISALDISSSPDYGSTLDNDRVATDFFSSTPSEQVIDELLVLEAESYNPKLQDEIKNFTFRTDDSSSVEANEPSNNNDIEKNAGFLRMSENYKIQDKKLYKKYETEEEKDRISICYFAFLRGAPCWIKVVIFFAFSALIFSLGIVIFGSLTNQEYSKSATNVESNGYAVVNISRSTIAPSVSEVLMENVSNPNLNYSNSLSSLLGEEITFNNSAPSVSTYVAEEFAEDAEENSSSETNTFFAVNSFDLQDSDKDRMGSLYVIDNISSTTPSSTPGPLIIGYLDNGVGSKTQDNATGLDGNSGESSNSSSSLNVSRTFISFESGDQLTNRTNSFFSIKSTSSTSAPTLTQSTSTVPPFTQKNEHSNDKIVTVFSTNVTMGEEWNSFGFFSNLTNSSVYSLTDRFSSISTPTTTEPSTIEDVQNSDTNSISALLPKSIKLPPRIPAGLVVPGSLGTKDDDEYLISPSTYSSDLIKLTLFQHRPVVVNYKANNFNFTSNVNNSLTFYNTTDIELSPTAESKTNETFDAEAIYFPEQTSLPWWLYPTNFTLKPPPMTTMENSSSVNELTKREEKTFSATSNLTQLPLSTPVPWWLNPNKTLWPSNTSPDKSIVSVPHATATSTAILSFPKLEKPLNETSPKEINSTLQPVLTLSPLLLHHNSTFAPTTTSPEELLPVFVTTILPMETTPPWLNPNITASPFTQENILSPTSLSLKNSTEHTISPSLSPLLSVAPQIMSSSTSTISPSLASADEETGNHDFSSLSDEDDNKVTKFSALAGPFDYNMEFYSSIKYLASSGNDMAVYLGNFMKEGDQLECSEKSYADFSNVIKGYSNVPFLLIPGRNDWSNCADPAKGLNLWRKYFTSNMDAFWFPDSSSVIRKKDQPETFSYFHGGILYIGITLTTNKENSELYSTQTVSIMAENLNWIDSQIATYGDEFGALIILADSGFNVETEEFFINLSTIVQLIQKPTIYMYASAQTAVTSNFLESIILAQIQDTTSDFMQISVYPNSISFQQ